MNNNKWSYCILSLIIGCFWTVSSWAQGALEDVVYLENGSVIRGQVIEYNPEKDIKIKILGGSVLVYKSSEVIKIEKEESLKKETTTAVKNKEKKSHIPSGVGLYHTVAGGTLLGLSDFFGPVPGLSLKTSTGWSFHRTIGLGAGCGLLVLGEYAFIPVYANIRGNFMKSSASLFYDINVGYGIALKDQMGVGFGGGSSLGSVQKAEGGLYLRPAIGIRFSSKRRTHVFLDFGYVIQFSRYEYRDWNNNPFTERRTFYRPSLRVGVVF